MHSSVTAAVMRCQGGQETPHGKVTVKLCFKRGVVFARWTRRRRTSQEGELCRQNTGVGNKKSRLREPHAVGCNRSVGEALKSVLEADRGELLTVTAERF